MKILVSWYWYSCINLSKFYIKIKILILTSTFIFGQSTVYKFALIYQLFLILNNHIDMMKRSLYLITGNVTLSFSSDEKTWRVQANSW